MKTDELRKDLERLTVEGKLRELFVSTRRSATEVENRGKRVIDFTSWDFLGTGHSAPLRRAVQQFIEHNEIALPSSRFSSGTTEAHINCEKRISRFFGAESALLFSSRNQALLSLVTSIGSERDTFFVHENSQSVVPDAAYLVNAQVEPFRDFSSLEKTIERSTLAGNRYLVLEAVSSFSGDPLDFQQLGDKVARYGLQLIIDESASLGVLGARGAGGTEILSDLTKKPASLNVFAGVVDFSRCAGSFGAAVFGSAILVTYLLQYSRVSKQEIPLPSPFAVATEKALDMIELAFLEREMVCAKAHRLKKMLPRRSLLTKLESQSPVVVLSLKNIRIGSELCNALFSKGFLVELLAGGQHLQESSLVRILLTSQHSDKEVEELGRALIEVLAAIEKE